MRLFGFEIARRTVSKEQALSPVRSSGRWFGAILESFTGAWQKNVEVDSTRDIMAVSAVFACCTRIASDIGKLRPKIVEESTKDGEAGICTELAASSPFWPVLRKPNHFQNRIKFIEQWVLSKLMHGNTYALKQRDGRGMVVALYLLDPTKVMPLVAQDGSVYYRLSVDHLSMVIKEFTVPASEIIHDMMCCLWHPLVGVSPIFACAMSATMGNRIQMNSTKFFANMSRPSGMLVAPGEITDANALALKTEWETNFSGDNVGRVAVLGGGLKYEDMGAIPAQEAQLIDQLKWTVEDVARAFGMPLFKIGGPVPSGITVEVLNQIYYNDCLQTIIESLELCLDEGLSLKAGMSTEFDLDGLMRMDTAARYEAVNKAVAGGWMSPNEARVSENYAPVKGGESPYLQQQNYSLAALAKRDAREDPFATIPKPVPEPSEPDPDDVDDTPDEIDPDEAAEEGAEKLMLAIIKKFTEAGAVYEL